MAAGALEIELGHQPGDEPHGVEGREVAREGVAGVLVGQRRRTLKPGGGGIVGHLVESEARQLGSGG